MNKITYLMKEFSENNTIEQKREMFLESLKKNSKKKTKKSKRRKLKK